MKSLKLISLIFVLLNLGSTFAGERTSSGGDAVVCFDKNKQPISVELWDYIEAEYEHGLTIDLPGETFIDKVKNVALKLDKLKRQGLDYDLSEEILEDDLVNDYYDTDNTLIDELKNLENPTFNSRFIKLISLKNRYRIKEIDDANANLSIDLDSNCKLVQIAFQEHRIRAVGSFIKIHKELWNLMSERDKAGLILHETFLAEINQDGPLTDTTIVRDLVNVVSMDEFANYSVFDFLQALYFSKIVKFADVHFFEEPNFYYTERKETRYISNRDLTEYGIYGRRELNDGYNYVKKTVIDNEYNRIFKFRSGHPEKLYPFELFDSGGHEILKHESGNYVEALRIRLKNNTILPVINKHDSMKSEEVSFSNHCDVVLSHSGVFSGCTTEPLTITIKGLSPITFSEQSAILFAEYKTKTIGNIIGLLREDVTNEKGEVLFHSGETVSVNGDHIMKFKGFSNE